jgi:uncharacterized protein (DUF1810 family)
MKSELIAPQRFDFGRLLPTKRPTYASTLATWRKGLLSDGFMWEIARRDEVFAAYLRRHKVPRP